MKSIYSSIYNNLCSSRVHLKETWKPGSNLHRHHIVPKHSGGTDDESNFTYLTIREHIIAHFLLWKMHRNPNDLRSMHMLGAKLTSRQRKIIGEFCRDNNIGFYSATLEQKLEWSNLGRKTMKEKSIGMYGFTYEQRSQWNAQFKLFKNWKGNDVWKFWMSPEGRKIRASMGGKAMKGRKAMFIPGQKEFKRVKIEEIAEHLSIGYVFGSPIRPNKDRKFGPSLKRRCVTDGTIIYDSLRHAAKAYNVSSSSIIHWIRTKKPGWSYLSSESLL
jgi:HNH endonuclease